METERTRELQRQAEADERNNRTGFAGFLHSLWEIFSNLLKTVFGAITDNDSEYSEVDRNNAAQSRQRTGADAASFLARVRPAVQALAQEYQGKSLENISPFESDAIITSGLGSRAAPTRGASTEHKGIDMVPANGGSRGVYNTMPGIVTRSEMQRDRSGNPTGFGWWVEVACIDGTRRRYAHLEGSGPAVGTVLHQGDRIANMGNTGTGSGAHLHYEWRAANGELLSPQINDSTFRRNDRSYVRNGVVDGFSRGEVLADRRGVDDSVAERQVAAVMSGRGRAASTPTPATPSRPVAAQAAAASGAQAGNERHRIIVTPAEDLPGSAMAATMSILDENGRMVFTSRMTSGGKGNGHLPGLEQGRGTWNIDWSDIRQGRGGEFSYGTGERGYTFSLTNPSNIADLGGAGRNYFRIHPMGSDSLNHGCIEFPDDAKARQFLTLMTGFSREERPQSVEVRSREELILAQQGRAQFASLPASNGTSGQRLGIVNPRTSIGRSV